MKITFVSWHLLYKYIFNFKKIKYGKKHILNDCKKHKAQEINLIRFTENEKTKLFKLESLKINCGQDTIYANTYCFFWPPPWGQKFQKCVGLLGLSTTYRKTSLVNLEIKNKKPYEEPK